ncbi:MAG: WG repeat-containing protein [Acidobacteriota bacterium]
MSNTTSTAFILVLAAWLAWADQPPSELPVPFEKDGAWGYVDAKGNVKIAPRFVLAQPFSSKGIAAVVDEQGWAYVGLDGGVLLRPLVVDNGPDYFSDGLARYIEKGKIGFFEEDGRKVIPPSFDYATPFQEGLASFCMGCTQAPEGEHIRVVGGRWGYIDAKGEVVIPAQFDEAGAFSGGCAHVKRDGRTFLIDKNGAELDEAAVCPGGA